ncbi:MAG: hypothetical protein QOE50_1223, partial [Sphingomonadales bacterium]|nr:hypothetical protein [Sphingomonadales bacterium]
MTALILCWLIAPAGLLIISIGLSLLVERLADFPVPWSVRPALGLSTAIVIAQFGTATDATAGLTVPTILALAAIGLLLGYGLLERIPSGWGTGAALAVFAVFAAPFLVIGRATWAGYIKLDDTATWMALTDHVFEFGRGVGNLAPSTHAVIINDYLSGGYPVGSFVPAKLMSVISGQDVAWTMQPSMAFAAAVLAMLIFGLVRPIVRGQPAAAMIATVGSLSSLLLGYSLWGGVKELVVAALLPLGPALAGHASRKGWPSLVAVPIGIAGAALIASLGTGGLIWLLPTLLPALIVLLLDRGRANAIRVAGWTLVVLLVLAIPVVITPEGVFNPLQKSLTIESELGNLNGPLNALHIAGLWPALDFRTDPHLKPAVLALAVVCLGLAAGTVFACVRLRGRLGVPFAAYAGGAAAGAVAIILVGSPWVDAKAMATASPALLAAAMLGIVLIRQRTAFRVEATV